MITVFIRTILIYIILILAIRLTGKRQIGELQVAELVVTFMLSELAVYPITDKNIPLSHAVIPIVSLLSLEVIFSFIQTKSTAFRKFFSGGPTVIINKGKLSPAELAKNRLDLAEFLGELRLKGVFDINDVEYAMLEENGKVSVLTKAAASGFTPEQLDIKVIEHGLSHPVIVDGTVNSAALSSANKTEKWLNNFLTENDAVIENIFLMTVDDSGGVCIYISDPSEKHKLIRQDHFKPKGSSKI